MATLSKCLEIPQISLEQLAEQTLNEIGVTDSKTITGFRDTTVKRTQCVLIEGTLVINIHAKEPKTAEAAELLADFIKKIVDTVPRLCDGFIVCSDTNIAKEPARLAFEQKLEKFAWSKQCQKPTTVKHRSLLHGQCYDDTKCLKTVSAAKDKIIGLANQLKDINIFPDLNNTGKTLPSIDWPSDHCRVQATHKNAHHEWSVSQLNCLGDDYNPFQFLALDDDQYITQYREVEKNVLGVKLQDFEPFLISLREQVRNGNLDKQLLKTVDNSLQQDGKNIWSMWSASLLKYDNKCIEDRINLITMALKPLSFDVTELQYSLSK